MSIISDAMFKGHTSLGDPQFLAEGVYKTEKKTPVATYGTAAIYGVLAGGYSVCPVSPELLKTPVMKRDSRGSLRLLCGGLTLLALASTVGLIAGSITNTWRPAGVFAEAGPRPEATAQARVAHQARAMMAAPAAPVAPAPVVAAASVAPAPAPVVAPAKPLAVAQPTQSFDNKLILANPTAAVLRRPVLQPVRKAAVATAVADNLPLGAAPAAGRIVATATAAPKATGAPSDTAEVLYEADPALANGASVSTKAISAAPVSDAAPTAEAPATVSGATTTAKSDSSEGKLAGGLRVSGIFWDRKRPMALLNDSIVEIGSSVGGAKVVDIQPSAVTIEENGLRRVLNP